MTKIKKIGFEVEGEFSPEFQSTLKGFGKMTSDGSVHACPHNSPFHEKYSTLDTAEFNSPPIDVKNKAEIAKIMREFNTAWREGHYHWNSSAGFHIHVSFSPAKPAEIFSTQFCDYFYKEMQKKFRGAYNTRKDNTFCKAKYTEEEIAQGTERYRGINMLPAFREHGTIEFRIFPASMPMRMFSFIMFTIKTIEDFSKLNMIIPMSKIANYLGRKLNDEITTSFSLKDYIELKNI